MKQPKLPLKHRLKSSALIVGWNTDIGKLGLKVIEYLNKKLGSDYIDEIEPTDFFQLGGVTIENDVVRFPQTKLYACHNRDIVMFIGDAPSYEWNKFFNLILDISERHGPLKELYIIGGMIILGAHTVPRELIPVFNSSELKQALHSFNLGKNMEYQTPPGQRPTLNSFLLWTARQRKIPAVCLWIPIPFYLVAVEDPKAQRRILEFLDRRLDLNIDFSDIDEEIRKQNERLERSRVLFPEINDSIIKLENNIRLSETEHEELVKQIQVALTEEELGV